MSEENPTSQTTAAEQGRRRVLRIATAYALVSWVLLQLGEITFEPLNLPQWSLAALIWLLVLGFPVAVVIAWLFDRGPRGLRWAPGGTTGKTAILLVAVLMIDSVAGYWLYTDYEQRERQSDTSAPAEVAAIAAVTAAPNSIAVLPFVDLSAEGNQRYFSDGISEEILNVLARVEGLRVAARTSSFALRGDGRDIREIGRLLSVATVLEGSIRKAGDSVRVTAQLIDTSNGFHLWSNNYDRRLEDIFLIQDEIAGEIVKELLGHYEGFAELRPDAPMIASFEAYDLYLQGRDLWQRRTPDSLTRAIDVFQRTLALDPAYALAYSGLADAYLLLSNYGNLSVAESVQRATPLIKTALELDGQMSEGFASLGLMYWTLGRYSAAETHLNRAVRLNEENTTAAMWLGTLIGSQGRLSEERLILSGALEKDPLNPLININLASNDLRRGEHQSGMGRLGQMLEVYPTSTPVLRTLAEWSLGYGHMVEAVDYAHRALSIAPDEPANQATMAQMFLSVGALDQARITLEIAMANSEDNASVVEHYFRYLMVAGHWDQLRGLAKARTETRSDQPVATREALMPMFWLARINLLEGASEQAMEYLDAMLEDTSVMSPDNTADTLTWSAAAHQMNDDPEGAEQRVGDAERILSQLRLQGVAAPGLAYLEACIAALRHDRDQAFSKLIEFQDHGWINPWDIEHDARLASLKDDPRFVPWLEAVRDHTEMTRIKVINQQLAGLDSGPRVVH